MEKDPSRQFPWNTRAPRVLASKGRAIIWSCVVPTLLAFAVLRGLSGRSDVAIAGTGVLANGPLIGFLVSTDWFPRDTIFVSGYGILVSWIVVVILTPFRRLPPALSVVAWLFWSFWLLLGLVFGIVLR